MQIPVATAVAAVLVGVVAAVTPGPAAAGPAGDCLAEPDVTVFDRGLKVNGSGDPVRLNMPSTGDSVGDARHTYVEIPKDDSNWRFPGRIARADGCLVGGDITVDLPETADWSSSSGGWKQTQGVTSVDSAYRPTIVDASIHDVGDGIVIGTPRSDTEGRAFTITNTRVTRAHDDCVQNDQMNSGTIEGSLFDGCYVFYSARAATSSNPRPDGFTETVEFADNLVHLEYMHSTFASGEHFGQLFKMPNNLTTGTNATGIAPRMDFSGNTFLIDGYQTTNGVDDNDFPSGPGSVPYETCDADDNVIIWNGTGSAPNILTSMDSDCFDVVLATDTVAGTSHTWLEEWENRRAAWLAEHTPGGRFVALPGGPEVAYDSRTDGPAQPLASTETSRRFDLRSITDLPTNARIGAVALNVSAINPSAAADLRIWGDGTKPQYSNLNVEVGADRSNAIVVQPGAAPIDTNETMRPYDASELQIALSSGSTHVTVQVLGYYEWAPAREGGRFEPVTPTRLLDTRTAGSQVTGPLTANTDYTVDLTIPKPGDTSSPVPAGATAVALNVTVADTTADGSIKVWPGGGTTPTEPALYWESGETTPNHVIVAPDANDEIEIRLSQAGDVVIDVFGYYTNDTQDTGNLSGTVPTRVLDTRDSGAAIVGPLTGGTTYDLQIAGSGLPIPQGATGAIVNVTVVGPTASGWLKVFPADAAIPNISTHNYLASDTLANLTQVQLPTTGSDAGKISLRANTGTNVHVIVDVVGYYYDLKT